MHRPRARRGVRPRTPFFTAMLVGFLAAPAAGQDADWTVLLSPQLSRKLDQDSGPSLGGLGAALQVYRDTPESSWAWGAAAALYRLGTFKSPNGADRGERALTLGLRGLRGSLWSGWYTNVGLDLLAVQESSGPVRRSTDPGVAGYLGAGWIHRTGPT